MVKSSSSKCKFLRDFQMLDLKFVKFLMSILKRKSIPFHIFRHFSMSFYITPLWIFSSCIFYFGQKDSIKAPILTPPSCSGENLSNSKSVFLQILHHSSVSWDKTPLYFFSWNFIYFQQKEPIKVQIWWNLTWQSKF